LEFWNEAIIEKPQYLLVMKQHTYHKREGPKKEKDLIDIFALAH